MKPTASWIKTFFSFYLPLIVWLGVIFYFSSLSGYASSRELTVAEWIVRKGAHIGEFFILTVLFFRLVWRHFSAFPARVFLLTAQLALLSAIADETHQYFTPLRQAKFTDVLIDCIGISLALFLFFVLMRMARRK